MRTEFPGGVWPTMITPFTQNDHIDFDALRPMVDWYIRNGVSGLFAVCQSSEMFAMTLDERIALATATLDAAGGRVPVIASGHISDSRSDQIDEINRIISTGVDAFVFVTNRFASEDESDEKLFRNLLAVVKEIPAQTPLGLYECPYPYKRLLTPELLRRIAETGRFIFLKDTSCRLTEIQAKIRVAHGTPLRLFNANASSLLSSMQAGAAGYSGIMSNSHPDLYVWLCNHWQTQPKLAGRIQAFLTTASVFEYQLYPVNAKYYQQLEGLPIRLDCRRADRHAFSESQRAEVEQMRVLSKQFSAEVSSHGRRIDLAENAPEADSVVGER